MSYDFALAMSLLVGAYGLAAFWIGVFFGIQFCNDPESKEEIPCGKK